MTSDSKVDERDESKEPPEPWRNSSPEFSPEYEQIQHFRRLRETRKSTPHPIKARKLRRLSKSVHHIELIQMANLARYHYEVWLVFTDNDAQLLRTDYVRGLKNALRQAVAAWGHHRVELHRWHPKIRRSPLVIPCRAESGTEVVVHPKLATECL